SIVNRRGAGAGAADAGLLTVDWLVSEDDCMPIAAVTTGAAAINSRSTARMLAGDSEADELLRVAVLIARLDLEDVLAGRQRRYGEFDLLPPRLWRRRGLQLVHRIAGAVQDVHLQLSRATRPVGRHADNETISAAEFARGGRNGLGI